MALLFLFNYSGNAASTYTLGSGTTATGYNLYNSISGNRSLMERTTKSASEVIRQYVYSAVVSVDYVVISRADLLLTANTTRLRLKDRTAGGTWAYISGIDYNPLTSASLIGIKSQDLVIAVTPAEFYGIALSTLPASGSEASQISKFYASDSVSLGVAQVGFETEELDFGVYATPIQGTLPYEVEKRFTLDFIGLTQAEIISFYAYPMLMTQPFFLYDSAGDIWTHKLEHVLLEDIEETFLEKDVYNLKLSFARLRHYE